MLFTSTTTMSSSSTSLAASTDLSFFTTLKFSSGSSTLVTTRVTAVPGPQDPRSGAPTIKVTAQETLSSTPWRDLDALSKRKSSDNLARKVAKRRRVSPPQDAPFEPRTRAPIASESSRYSSRASSLLSVDSSSTPSTRATSVASVPPPPPPRECWIDEKGDPGDDVLSSEAVVLSLMKGYKSCECSIATAFPSLFLLCSMLGCVAAGICGVPRSQNCGTHLPASSISHFFHWQVRQQDLSWSQTRLSMVLPGLPVSSPFWRAPRGHAAWSYVVAFSLRST